MGPDILCWPWLSPRQHRVRDVGVKRSGCSFSSHLCPAKMEGEQLGCPSCLVWCKCTLCTTNHKELPPLTSYECEAMMAQIINGAMGKKKKRCHDPEEMSMLLLWRNCTCVFNEEADRCHLKQVVTIKPQQGRNEAMLCEDISDGTHSMTHPQCSTTSEIAVKRYRRAESRRMGDMLQNNWPGFFKSITIEEKH